MIIRKLHIILLCCVIFTSCHWGMPVKDDKQKSTDVEVVRYDKLLFEYVELNSFSALQKMNTEHLQATKFLIEDILRLGQVSDNNINAKLKSYFSDPTLCTLMKDASTKFEDMEPIEKQLSLGFKNLRKEVPEIKIPAVYSQISALNESVIVGDSLLGFSIDKYLGEDYPLYKRFFYDYQCRSMKPERIVPDCFTFFLLSEYPFPTEGNRTLLDFIIHDGKIQYVVSKILDIKSFEKTLGYSTAEIEWCKNNKKAIWDYMVQNGHLYATDPMIIRHYTKSAPYTAFFGENSPAMLGTWMGVLLVDSYMKHHKDVSIKDLLEMTDYQTLLAESKFKP